MKLATSCSLLTLVLGLAVVAPSVRAEEGAKPEEKKAEKKEDKAKGVKGPRLFGFYAKMSTLTPELKIKIEEIHKKSLEAKREVEAKEEAEIAALLSDEQKLELQKLKEDESAAKKAAADKRKEKDEPKKDADAKGEEKKDGM